MHPFLEAVCPIIRIILRYGLIELDSQRHPRLIGPAPRHILDSVASSPHHNDRDSKPKHIVETGPMTFNTEIELAESIVSKGVCSELDDDCIGSVVPHDPINCRLEELVVGGIANAFFERYVERVVFALALADAFEVAGAREEVVTVLMEANSHDTASQQECLFYTISVVHVDVDIEHPRVYLQKFENTQDYVVDVAESAGLALLGMVQSTSPIDSHVGFA